MCRQGVDEANASLSSVDKINIPSIRGIYLDLLGEPLLLFLNALAYLLIYLLMYIVGRGSQVGIEHPPTDPTDRRW